MATRILAPADTLAGKLQRGLGSGYIEATRRPRGEIGPLVFDCIANDPRDDAQVESRALFYARLLLALDIDEQPIAAILQARPDADQSSTTSDWLPIGVLGVLARSGRTGARAILRDYIGWGAWWAEALRELAETGDAAATAGLDAVLAGRFTEHPDEIFDVAGDAEDEPWRSWRYAGPLAPILDSVPPYVEPAEPDFASLEPRELLALAGPPHGRWNRAVDALAARIRGGSTADRLVAEEALASPDLDLTARAVWVLGSLGDVTVIPAGERVLDALRDVDFTPLGYRRRMVLGGFRGLPPRQALDIARRWRDATDYRGSIAASLLADHATADDLTWTLDRIRRTAAAGGHLPYARILRRFPGSGPFDGFAEICRADVPSCCRAKLMDALSIADPTFGATLAPEGLFDCEPLAREAAARTVSLAPEGIVELLAALAADPLEEPEVRTAAANRALA